MVDGFSIEKINHSNFDRDINGANGDPKIGIKFPIYVKSLNSVPLTIEDFAIRLGMGRQWPFIEELPDHDRANPEKTYKVLLEGEHAPINNRFGFNPSYSADYNIKLPAEVRPDFFQFPPPIVGYVIFSDPVGTTYLQHFAFIATAPPNVSFVRYGGNAYNFEQEFEYKGRATNSIQTVAWADSMRKDPFK